MKRTPMVTMQFKMRIAIRLQAAGLMENFIFTVQFCQSPCVRSILGNPFSSDTHIHRMKKSEQVFFSFLPRKRKCHVHHNYITNRACHKENVY